MVGLDQDRLGGRLAVVDRHVGAVVDAADDGGGGGGHLMMIMVTMIMVMMTMVEAGVVTWPTLAVRAPSPRSGPWCESPR